MKTGCEIMHCTDFKYGVCHYEGDACKFRADCEKCTYKEKAEKWDKYMQEKLRTQVKAVEEENYYADLDRSIGYEEE